MNVHGWTHLIRTLILLLVFGFCVPAFAVEGSIYELPQFGFKATIPYDWTVEQDAQHFRAYPKSGISEILFKELPLYNNPSEEQALLEVISLFIPWIKDFDSMEVEITNLQSMVSSADDEEKSALEQMLQLGFRYLLEAESEKETESDEEVKELNMIGGVFKSRTGSLGIGFFKLCSCYDGGDESNTEQIEAELDEVEEVLNSMTIYNVPVNEINF